MFIVMAFYMLKQEMSSPYSVNLLIIYFLRKEDFQNFYCIYKYTRIAKASGESNDYSDCEIY